MLYITRDKNYMLKNIECLSPTKILNLKCILDITKITRVRAIKHWPDPTPYKTIDKI